MPMRMIALESDLTMCKSRTLSYINFENSTILQMVINMLTHLKLEQNYHQNKHNFNSFPTIYKSKQLDQN